jgi:hypothetical protein
MDNAGGVAEQRDGNIGHEIAPSRPPICAGDNLER